MKNFPKDIVIIWFDGAMMSKDDFVEVAAVKIADGIVSEYCQYFVNADIDGKPIDAAFSRARQRRQTAFACRDECGEGA